jgi:AraC-like DNA-binding protein
MHRIVFASDALPAALDDQARFALWRDVFASTICPLDLFRADDRPFSLRFEFMQLGEVGLAMLEGTTNRFLRTPQHVAASQNDDFVFGVNRGQSRLVISHVGHESTLKPGMALLLNNSEPGEVRGSPQNSWLPITVSRRQLLQLVRNAEDLLGLPIDGNQPALRHLRRYIGLLQEPEGIADDPPLIAHMGATLADLIALALGASGDAAQLARSRGLRAARLRTIKADIASHLGEHELCVNTVAARQGVSPRYVQMLFEAEGATFSRFVLCQRLARAHRLLTDPRCAAWTVTAIALEAGFGDLSTFNHAFRRAYGASPSEVRASARREGESDTPRTGHPVDGDLSVGMTDMGQNSPVHRRGTDGGYP